MTRNYSCYRQLVTGDVLVPGYNLTDPMSCILWSDLTLHARELSNLESCRTLVFLGIGPAGSREREYDYLFVMSSDGASSRVGWIYAGYVRKI